VVALFERVPGELGCRVPEPLPRGVVEPGGRNKGCQSFNIVIVF